MAKTATERKREQRERDKQSEEERLSRLLSRSIKLDLFKSTDMALIRGMARMGIDEPQDYISRLIHNADLLNDNGLERMTRLPQ
jgi:hypothetical protein